MTHNRYKNKSIDSVTRPNWAKKVREMIIDVEQSNRRYGKGVAYSAYSAYAAYSAYSAYSA